MRAGCGKRCFGYAVMALVGVAVAGLLVMLLWNWLMPALFGWKPIQFMQAVGLLILGRLLFGRFHGHGGMWRSRMEARWQAMTPEEQERFRAGMHGCWGRRRSAGAPDGE